MMKYRRSIRNTHTQRPVSSLKLYNMHKKNIERTPKSQSAACSLFIIDEIDFSQRDNTLWQWVIIDGASIID